MKSFEEGPFTLAINTLYLRCGQMTHGLAIKVSLERNTNNGVRLTNLFTPETPPRPSTTDHRVLGHFMG